MNTHYDHKTEKDVFALLPNFSSYNAYATIYMLLAQSRVLVPSAISDQQPAYLNALRLAFVLCDRGR